MEIKISIVSVLRKRKFERGLIEWSSWQQWQTPVELSKGKERLEKLEEERDNSIAIAGDANASPVVDRPVDKKKKIINTEKTWTRPSTNMT